MTKKKQICSIPVLGIGFKFDVIHFWHILFFFSLCLCVCVFVLFAFFGVCSIWILFLSNLKMKWWSVHVCDFLPMAPFLPRSKQNKKTKSGIQSGIRPTKKNKLTIIVRVDDNNSDDTSFSGIKWIYLLSTNIISTWEGVLC